MDTGTSILIDNPARLDFNAETVIRAMAEVYHGRSVILQVDAANKQFKVELANQPLKTIPLKGLEHR